MNLTRRYRGAKTATCLFLQGLFSLLCLLAHGQSLIRSHNHGYYTYIIQLTNAQTRQYVNGPEEFSHEEVMKAPLDSFCSDSIYRHTLNPGNYLYLRARENKLESKLHLIPGFEVMIAPTTTELAVIVMDKAGKELGDARVFINGTPIPYNPIKRWYSLPRANNRGPLVVEEGSCIQFHELDREFNNSIWTRSWHLIQRTVPVKWIYLTKYRIQETVRRYRDDDDGDNRRYGSVYGYVDFSKPKYLPHDTVKFKAFLTSRKAKPLRKAVTVRLYKDYIGDKSNLVFSTLLKPVSRGAYTYSFVLNDSLPVDHTYFVQLLSASGKRSYRAERFRYEDYQLDETHYEAHLNKKSVTAADSVIIHLSGTDANALPLLDGRFNIVITRTALTGFYPDSLYVPDTLWVHQGYLENTAETQVLIPPALIPEIKGEYEINVSFNNSNFETHDEVLFFDVDKRSEMLGLQISDSLLHAGCSGSKTSADAYWLVALDSKSDTLSRQQVMLPHSEPLNPMASGYTLVCKHQQSKLDMASEGSGVRMLSQRTRDSVFFQLVNPHFAAVTYTIYKNQHLVESGLTRSLNWKCADRSTASYTVHCNYTWAGEAAECTAHASCFENNLQILIDQPETVYPGQTVKMKVEVRDYQGRPVKNVNLCGGCVNSLFKEAAVADVPYFGKQKKGIPFYNKFTMREHSTYSLHTDLNNEATTHFLSSYFRKRFKLDTIAWYKAVFPSTGFCMKQDSIGNSKAQFAAFVFSHGVQKQIYSIHADGRLVYWYSLAGDQPYSIILNPGKHRLLIRLRDKTVQIDTLVVRDHFKTNLVVDLAIQNPNVTLWDENPFLSSNEAYEAEQHTLCLSNLAYHSMYSIQQGNKICLLNDVPYTYYSGNETVLGPFAPGLDIKIVKRDEYTVSFPFESNYSYETRDQFVKMRERPGHSRLLPIPQDQPTAIDFWRRAYEESDIQIHSPAHAPNPFVYETKIPEKDTKGNGSFQCRYAGDSMFYAVSMRLVGADSSNHWIFRGSKTTWYDLTPGTYRFQFITPGGYYFEKEIVIRSNSTYGAAFSNLHFKKLGEVHHFFFSEMQAACKGIGCRCVIKYFLLHPIFITANQKTRCCDRCRYLFQCPGLGRAYSGMFMSSHTNKMSVPCRQIIGEGGGELGFTPFIGNQIRYPIGTIGKGSTLGLRLQIRLPDRIPNFSKYRSSAPHAPNFYLILRCRDTAKLNGSNARNCFKHRTYAV